MPKPYPVSSVSSVSSLPGPQALPPALLPVVGRPDHRCREGGGVSCECAGRRAPGRPQVRLLADEARDAGAAMVDRTAWRICRDNAWWSAFGKTRARNGKKPGPPVYDDLCTETARRLQGRDGPDGRRGQVRRSEGSVVHVEVFRMGSVGTSIIGGPRPLSRHRRTHHRYTLNCEEPLCSVPAAGYRSRSGGPASSSGARSGRHARGWWPQCRGRAAMPGSLSTDQAARPAHSCDSVEPHVSRGRVAPC